MAFCTQCGNQVQDTDLFCGRCGSAQASAAAAWAGPKPGTAGAASRPVAALGGIDARTASILCYIPIVGWIASIVVLASDKFRNDTETRFHAFQGLYLFVAWLIVDWVIGPIGRISGSYMGMNPAKILKLVIFGTWIFMLVKVSHREHFKLPVLGEWAEKSVSEQR
jgi:uncharacterized membrane protein